MHDLVARDRRDTGRLAPGQRRSVDVGVVGRDLDGWCSVAGHRQMGMVFADPGHRHGAGRACRRATATARHPRSTADDAGHAAATAHAEAEHQPPQPARHLDLMADPAPGFARTGRRAAAAATSRVHRLTLVVRDVGTEVAPGVTQTLWTYNGTAPGPTLRGRVGDVFEITLVNDGSIGHSIDFHAGALAPDRPMRTISPGRDTDLPVHRHPRRDLAVPLLDDADVGAHRQRHVRRGHHRPAATCRAVDREYLLVQSELYLGAQGGAVDATKLARRGARPGGLQRLRQPVRPRPAARRGSASGCGSGCSTPAPTGQRRSTSSAASSTPSTPRAPTCCAADEHRRQPGARPAAGPGRVRRARPSPRPGDYPFVSHLMIDAERGAHGMFRVTP